MKLHTVFFQGSVLAIALGSLALTSCATAGSDDDQSAQDAQDGQPQDDAAPNVCANGHWQCKSHIVVDEHSRIRADATPSGFGPADLTAAYGLKASVTSTATIAIVDAFNYANAESDLATYRSQYGLSACTVANGCLQILNQNGAKTPLPAKPPAGDDWTVEAALDLDMASAACPTCKLILFEAQDDEGDGLFVAQNAAAASGAVSISNSWGGPSDGTDNTLDSEFFTHTQAVNVFVASGDAGNTGTTPDYPSTSAHVIGVGGTTLKKSASAARGWTETVWNGSGSSCSKVIAKPSFQSVVPAAACAKRAAADVSAVANPNTGLAVYNKGSGGWIVVGGTSAASPFVAGVFARYGITGANHDARYVYNHTGQFFDITSGKNGTCTTALCKAGTGWDGPSGIGSPNGAKL